MGSGCRGTSPVGALSPLPGRAGCIYEPPEADAEPSPLAEICTPGRALLGATAVAISPDGRNVYVGASGDEAVAVFARDPSTGALRQLPGSAGCVAETPETWGCMSTHPLFDLTAIAVSPDGKNVYAVAGGYGLTVFRRVPGSGALIPLSGQTGCVTGTLIGDSQCAAAEGMDDPNAIAISRDGRSA